MGQGASNFSIELYQAILGRKVMQSFGGPNGVRTRVTGVRGRCPRPLDDGTLKKKLGVGSLEFGVGTPFKNSTYSVLNLTKKSLKKMAGGQGFEPR